MNQRFNIHPDIRKAETLPAFFYRDSGIFEELKEKVFLKTWQWIGDENQVPLAGHVYPFILLDGFLSEPMLLSRTSDTEIKCFTNVCTHRGNIVVQYPARVTNLMCMYHGRRFDMTGKFKSMPEFSAAEDFPRPCDDLRNFPLKKWGPFLFAGFDPEFDLSEVLEVINERVGFLPLHEFTLDQSRSKDYLVHAHWALYCDNYLEGFHIPFVHEELNRMLNYENYTSEIYRHCNLQIGYADDGEELFDLPEGHVDYGKKVAAYFYWVFPNMMFNFYPWGLSVNVVKPLTPDKTRVSFISYVFDKSRLNKGTGVLMDKVEREDEFVVEAVHKGMQSRFYKNGRFSPEKEKGVHHFHSLLATYMNRR